jgi:nucleolar GTP-binding protein
MVSQAKKTLKNRPKLPASVKVRTLSELTRDMTAAGLDPSRIEERAILLAKARGAKRKRDEGEGMDVDGEADTEGWEDEGMEVDGEERTLNKRAKANTGTVMARNKREPRSNRQLAGMRDDAVRAISHPVFSVLIIFWLRGAQQADRATKLRNLGQRPRNMLAKAGEADRVIRTKMVRVLAFSFSCRCMLTCARVSAAEASVRRKA